MIEVEKRSLLPEKKVVEALAGLHRSVAACQFYPQDHPMLAEALNEGYRLWRAAEEDYRWEAPGLELRSGNVWLGENPLGKESPAVTTLVRTVSGHGVIGLRKTGPFSLDGFSYLVRMLATSPDVLASRGGLAGAWKKSPYASALEVQGLAVVAGSLDGGGAKSKARDGWGAALPTGDEVAALGDPLLLSRLQAFKQNSPREKRVLELLLRLGTAADITVFLTLLREITGHVQGYLEGERYREAFHVVLFLHREAQNMEALGEGGKRDYLGDTVRLLVRGDFLQWLIAHVASARGDEEAKVGKYILRALGRSAVVPLVNALVGEETRIGRRCILEVLVAVGPPVLPYAIKMLDDQRWYVVRNMVTILGGLGSTEALKALGRMATDPDPRIRKEVAKALARIDDPEVEEHLLRLLGDADPSVRLVAVTASVGHRSERMLDALWQLYRRTSIRAPGWNLKAVIVQVIGRNAGQPAAALLASVIRKRRWLQRERWTVVRRAAVRALGELEGDEARSLLEKLREHGNPEVRGAAQQALSSGEAVAAVDEAGTN